MSLIMSMKDCDTMSVNPSLSVSNPLQQTPQQLLSPCHVDNLTAARLNPMGSCFYGIEHKSSIFIAIIWYNNLKRKERRYALYGKYRRKSRGAIYEWVTEYKEDK